MLNLLLNANLSPETAKFLRKEFSFDVRCIVEENLGKIPDQEIAAVAKKEKRVIITSDLDFGQIYHFDSSPRLGVIVLRLSDQTIENVNATLKKFFTDYQDHEKLNHSLVVVKENQYRFYKNRD